MVEPVTERRERCAGALSAPEVDGRDPLARLGMSDREAARPEEPDRGVDFGVGSHGARVMPSAASEAVMIWVSRSDVIVAAFANRLIVMRRRASSANSTGSAMSRSGQVAARSCRVTMSVMVISQDGSIDRLQQIGWAVGQAGRDANESAYALRTLVLVNR